jgi:hypothetical protein
MMNKVARYINGLRYEIQDEINNDDSKEIGGHSYHIALK